MIVHLDGRLLPAHDARVSVFDRGFIFGDGIYEGLRSVPSPGPSGTRVIGLRRHIRRMADGLRDARIDWNPADLGPLVDALLAANNLRDAFVYWQVTRGTPPAGAPVRSRVPAPGTRPTVFGYCTPLTALPALPNPDPPIKTATTAADLRWLRGGMKSTSLIANILASLTGAESRADEVILIRDVGPRRLVTEGTYTNVVIATPSGELVTPALDSAPMLPGVTRRILLDLDPALLERPVDESDLRGAAEILLLGTTTLVTSVTRLDGRPVGTGSPGPAARRLLTTLLRAIDQGREDLPV
ncbi:MAG: aminotransferase class IV [Phycisphaerales bacterium]